MLSKLLNSKWFRLFWEYFILWSIGGVIYYGIELIWRGYSHPSMYVLGGLCFVAIGLINQFYLTWKMKLYYQMLIGTFIITLLEFIVGLIVNVWLGWNVWDYSNMPFNILGQICLPYMILWYFLSFVAILLDDYLRYAIFHEDKPYYYLRNNDALIF